MPAEMQVRSPDKAVEHPHLTEWECREVGVNEHGIATVKLLNTFWAKQLWITGPLADGMVVGRRYQITVVEVRN